MTTEQGSEQEPQATPGAEDRKLVTLARATRARARSAEGAAVRDQDGRTYAAATVALPSLQVSALGVCVAMAIASGARSLEAAVVLGEAEAVGDQDLAVVRDFAGAGVPVHLADPRGALRGTTTS
ncbi:MAG: cytidine deaminase [Nocardioides alkalitolerans]